MKGLLWVNYFCLHFGNNFHLILDIEPGKAKTTHVSDFCECGHCSLMETELENICCKSKRICVTMPDDICITAHHDFDTIINKGS